MNAKRKHCRHKLKPETREMIDCHNWIGVSRCRRCGAEVIVRSGVWYGKTQEVTNWHGRAVGDAGVVKGLKRKAAKAGKGAK